MCLPISQMLAEFIICLPISQMLANITFLVTYISQKNITEMNAYPYKNCLCHTHYVKEPTIFSPVHNTVAKRKIQQWKFYPHIEHTSLSTYWVIGIIWVSTGLWALFLIIGLCHFPHHLSIIFINCRGVLEFGEEFIFAEIHFWNLLDLYFHAGKVWTKGISCWGPWKGKL